MKEFSTKLLNRISDSESIMWQKEDVSLRKDTMFYFRRKLTTSINFDSLILFSDIEFGNSSFVVESRLAV